VSFLGTHVDLVSCPMCGMGVSVPPPKLENGGAQDKGARHTGFSSGPGSWELAFNGQGA
jgi:hypothetical protein